MTVFSSIPPGLLAALWAPSYTSFPFLGSLLLCLFLTTTATAIAAVIWISREHEAHGIQSIERWYLIFGAILAATVFGTAQVGPLSLPIPLLAVGYSLYRFTQERDKRVEKSKRILTAEFPKNIVRMIQDARRGGSQEPATPVAPREPILKQIQTFVERLSKKRHAKPEKAELPDFLLYKKDGTIATSFDQPDKDLSANVLAMRDILINAIRRGATDVHMEPHDKQYAIRFRVDGVLQDSQLLSSGAGRGAISALKVVADMDIAERRRPQDGGFAAVHERVKYDIRAACSPTSYGEKMVMRLLNSSGGVMSAGLGNIGLRSQILESLREVIHKPYGMFLVTGPTGSGKTTTVYASLSEIDAQKHNITTIEDPVEYRLDGITQIAVNSQAGVTFASILRSILRQDPDVLLVGEIRDRETAEIACQAALTGHFVFSTLHANDTVSTITRMLDLELDPMLIQTAVTAVLGQRLARRLCRDCREPYEPPPDLLKKLGVPAGVVKTIFKSKGCDMCGQIGFKGRVGIHELMVMNDAIRSLITESPQVEALKRAARKAGTRSLQTDGLLKVLKGLTSVDEIVRVTN